VNEGRRAFEAETLEGQFCKSELDEWRPPSNVVKQRRGNRVLVGHLGYDDSFNLQMPALQARDAE